MPHVSMPYYLNKRNYTTNRQSLPPYMYSIISINNPCLLTHTRWIRYIAMKGE